MSISINSEAGDQGWTVGLGSLQETTAAAMTSFVLPFAAHERQIHRTESTAGRLSSFLWGKSELNNCLSATGYKCFFFLQ